MNYFQSLPLEIIQHIASDSEHLWRIMFQAHPGFADYIRSPPGRKLALKLFTVYTHKEISRKTVTGVEYYHKDIETWTIFGFMHREDGPAEITTRVPIPRHSPVVTGWKSTCYETHYYYYNGQPFRPDDLPDVVGVSYENRKLLEIWHNRPRDRKNHKLPNRITYYRSGGIKSEWWDARGDNEKQKRRWFKDRTIYDTQNRLMIYLH